ncbi:type II toxin-antitoxin system PemK/MazF family toxin [Actinomyces sp. ZJ308]|uniref:type II toxin-antitoxin system PemK/MazF family toxin n=1 Tax=Actinomyces sp. ZJ308 TaxID=2708342 RepID=UPI0014205341|nr:type II toxin-antitoxin system PemK/MazF family toxin [Actinomyces sp. ZJ308]
MRRGEIWMVAGGVYASKPRPAVIVQDDIFNLTSSVTVVPLTTSQVDASFLRLPIPADAESGLAHDSDAMIDKLTTVRRSNVGEKVGCLRDSDLRELERLLLAFLGISR